MIFWIRGFKAVYCGRDLDTVILSRRICVKAKRSFMDGFRLGDISTWVATLFAYVLSNLGFPSSQLTPCQLIPFLSSAYIAMNLDNYVFCLRIIYWYFSDLANTTCSLFFLSMLLALSLSYHFVDSSHSEPFVLLLPTCTECAARRSSFVTFTYVRRMISASKKAELLARPIKWRLSCVERHR